MDTAARSKSTVVAALVSPPPSSCATSPASAASLPAKRCPEPCRRDRTRRRRSPTAWYAEQFSGTAFTAPRQTNRRSWAVPPAPRGGGPALPTPLDAPLLKSAPFEEMATPPTAAALGPSAAADGATDFVAASSPWAGNGTPQCRPASACTFYACNRSMHGRYFYDADGELLLVPQQGALRLATELGRLEVKPGEIALIPRGMRFQVDLPGRGPRPRLHMRETTAAHFRLPELGPIGPNGLANARDFWHPSQRSRRARGFELVAKFAGGLWSAPIDHSPLDVVAWTAIMRRTSTTWRGSIPSTR